MCIPIIFGCPVSIKPEGEQVLRLCPRCHNMTVCAAKSTRWFELFWVPLVPLSRKHILVCSTCQWSQPVNKNQTSDAEPQSTGQSSSAGAAAQAPNRPGYQYQPTYMSYPVQGAPKS